MRPLLVVDAQSMRRHWISAGLLLAICSACRFTCQNPDEHVQAAAKRSRTGDAVGVSSRLAMRGAGAEAEAEAEDQLGAEGVGHRRRTGMDGLAAGVQFGERAGHGEGTRRCT